MTNGIPLYWTCRNWKKIRLDIHKFTLFNIFYQRRATNVKLNNSSSSWFWKWCCDWKKTRNEIYNRKAGSIAVVALDVYANKCLFYVSWYKLEKKNRSTRFGGSRSVSSWTECEQNEIVSTLYIDAEFLGYTVFNDTKRHYQIWTT